MPEAAVDENYLSTLAKNKVWSPRYILHMQPKTIPSLVK